MTSLVAMAIAVALLPNGVVLELGAQTATPAPSQTPPAPTAPPAPPPVAVALTSLEVRVVITRLSDGKPVSALPYTLAVTSDSGEAQLNMGAEVPVPSTTLTPIAPAPASGAGAGAGAAGATASRPITSMNYRPIGTVITCRANSRDAGRYLVQLSVDDSTVFSSDSAAPPMPVGSTMPVFRSFRSRNTLLLRDGETRQYTAAADRVSGEMVRVEVTLRVVK